MSLKYNLTCSYCSKILENPIELPCEDLICKGHLTEANALKQKKIECRKCGRKFDINENEFTPASKFVKQLLNEEAYLSEEEIALKTKLNELTISFHEIYKKFLLNKTKLDLNCHNHFEEIRFQIAAQRDKLKVKIDDITLEMIEQTRKYETSHLECFTAKLESLAKSFQTKSIDSDLNEIKETFRNSNLLIDTAREMQRNREASINEIQSKLNELSQQTEHLKESNEFKPNLLFDHDSFGAVNLNFNDPFNSNLLTGQQPAKLINLCEFSHKDKWTLLYRATRDGFDSNDFHSKCDGHSNTLTLCKAKETSFVFGGFTTVSWDDTNQYKFDSNAFLFSLTNKDNQPCKMSIDDNRIQYAIECYSGYGPIFGRGNDICIRSDSNTTTHSSSNLGHTYKHSQYGFNTNEAKSFLAGSQYFLLSEIEVFNKE
jgi:hypothetical protein